MMDNDRLI